MQARPKRVTRFVTRRVDHDGWLHSIRHPFKVETEGSNPSRVANLQPPPTAGTSPGHHGARRSPHAHRASLASPRLCISVLDGKRLSSYLVGMESKGATLVDGSKVQIAQRIDGAFDVFMVTPAGDRAYGFSRTAQNVEAARAAASEMADAYLSME
jgi:hypothetical protein